ncbi:MAG: CRISPR-associated endoribonuclease Cas6, partial [Thermoplasmata archaeon]
MRLLLKMEAKKDMAYDEKYFHKFQGFVYKHIEPYYKELHDKKGYKFFCFSNLFPIGDMKKEDKRNWVISSPDSAMIKWLYTNIPEEIHLGEMEFFLKERKIFVPKVEKKIVAATPIIVRIPEKNYEKYGIPKEYRKKRYIYWRPCYSFDAFVKQLEENLLKKYEEFYGKKIKIDKLFEFFKFKKSVANHVIIEGKEQIFIGSLWEFYFSKFTKEQKEILKFGLDAGFG